MAGGATPSSRNDNLNLLHKMSQIDWNEVREFYLSCRSYKLTAERFGLSIVQVKSRAIRGNWKSATSEVPNLATCATPEVANLATCATPEVANPATDATPPELPKGSRPQPHERRGCGAWGAQEG